VLQARPLYDTDADARLFVAPPEWDRILAGVDHGFNVLVLGDRGSGKTTILRQVQHALRERGESVAFLDATGVTDAGELVQLIEQSLIGRRNAAEEVRVNLVGAFDAVAGGPPGSTSVRAIQRLRALGDLPATRIIVDCSHAAEAANVLFGRLRDELWQLGHRWLVAGERSERSILLAPPADAFFDQVTVVGGVRDPAFMRALLLRRSADVPSNVIDRIVDAARTPRDALQALRDAVVDGSQRHTMDARFARQEAAAAIGRPHSMVMTELEELGGASASDEELLSRLGWSRARASQVLGDLARHGLVVGSDERPPSGGRPRRIYRPAATERADG
jgi:energy-coupling factor transporter ATP-binding protein EcfA2